MAYFIFLCWMIAAMLPVLGNWQLMAFVGLLSVPVLFISKFIASIMEGID